MGIAAAAALSARGLALSAAAIGALSLLVAYFFMERFLLLPPCPLCILDRFAVAIFGAACAALALCHWRGWRGWAWGAWGIAAAAIAAGVAFAARHVWLQSRPWDEAAECLSSAAAARGLIDLVGKAFNATADCGAVVWEFAGLSVPEQTLALFVALAAMHLATGLRLATEAR